MVSYLWRIFFLIIATWAATFKDAVHYRPARAAMIDMRGTPDNEGICKVAGFKRNLTDCAQFYRCVDFYNNGKRYVIFRFMCGPMAIFDESRSICTGPDLARPPCLSLTLTSSTSITSSGPILESSFVTETSTLVSTETSSASEFIEPTITDLSPTQSIDIFSESIIMPPGFPVFPTPEIFFPTISVLEITSTESVESSVAIDSTISFTTFEEIQTSMIISTETSKEIETTEVITESSQLITVEPSTLILISSTETEFVSEITEFETFTISSELESSFITIITESTEITESGDLTTTVIETITTTSEIVSTITITETTTITPITIFSSEFTDVEQSSSFEILESSIVPSSEILTVSETQMETLTSNVLSSTEISVFASSEIITSTPVVNRPPSTPIVPEPPPDTGIFQIQCGKFFRFPLDCTRFYQCFGEGENLDIFVFSCNKGLLFDEEKEQCLNPEETEPCNENNILQNNNTLIDIAKPNPIISGVFSIKCGNEDLHRYPLDCHRFYQCYQDGDHKSIIVFSCLSGLVFDEETHECKKPEETSTCDINENTPEITAAAFQRGQHIKFQELVQSAIRLNQEPSAEEIPIPFQSGRHYVRNPILDSSMDSK